MSSSSEMGKRNRSGLSASAEDVVADAAGEVFADVRFNAACRSKSILPDATNFIVFRIARVATF